MMNEGQGDRTVREPDPVRLQRLGACLLDLDGTLDVQYWGSGTFGDTFRVTTDSTIQSVKVFEGDSADPDRMEREIRALKLLDHPSVARYIDDGWLNQPNGETSRYLAYEFVEGIPVSAFINSGKTASVTDLLSFAAAMLDGLRSIHAVSLAHRDLSANNIILKDGSLSSPVIIDFGWARHLDLPMLTVYPQRTGTLPFMAPEQIQGREATSFCDLWALGVNVHWMATGRHPYIDRWSPRPTPSGILSTLHACGVRPFQSTHPELASLVRTCLSLPPAKRTTAARLLRLVESGGQPD